MLKLAKLELQFSPISYTPQPPGKLKAARRMHYFITNQYTNVELKTLLFGEKFNSISGIYFE